MNDAKGELLERLISALGPDKELRDVKFEYESILSDYSIAKAAETEEIDETEKNKRFVDRFLLAKSVSGCTDKTRARYAGDLHRVLKSMGKSADEVTSEDVQLELSRIMNRASKVTVQNYMRSMSSFFKWMEREEIIVKNPMTKIEPIRVRKRKKAAFSDMEVERLRGACKDDRERCAVEILLSTGCRVSELVSIKVNDADGDELEIIGKGEKPRTIYLNAKARIAIANYMSQRMEGDPYLLTPLRRTKTAGITSNSVESMVRDIGRRAGVSPCHPHRFRRTCATMALKRGMPIEQVSRMLGHESVTTTQIYLDLSDEELKNSHRKYVI